MDLIKLELNFHKREIYFPCTDNFQLIKNNFNIYYNIDNNYIYNNEEYQSISYQIYYLYNGAIGFGKSQFPENECLGFHEYDIERVKILFDIDTNKPKYVYFSAHKNEGRWLSWDKCKKNENGDLKIFVSRASHANYPSPGIWFRILFLANDNCSNSGMVITPELLRGNFTFDPPSYNINSSFLKRIFLLKN